MSGNKQPGMVLQDRDLNLLRELAILRVVDRELAKTVAGFNSTTRVNARLLALVRAGLLRRFAMGAAGVGQKYLYALTRKGARYLGVPFRGPRRRSNAPLVADIFIEHQLAINSVYRAVKCQSIPAQGVSFIRWISFFEPVAPGLQLIPDGYFELQVTPDSRLAAFLEVDLGHENLTVWKKKVESYIQFAISGDFAKRFGQSRFRVLVVANSERRLQSLRKAVAAVTDRVFWFVTLDAVSRAGIAGPIWLRPLGTERQPLLGNLQ